MKTRSLKILIKQKKLQIDELLAKTKELTTQIESLERRIDSLHHEMDTVDQIGFRNVWELSMAKERYKELVLLENEIRQKIEAINETLQRYNKEMVQKMGEKKGLEKLLERMRQKQERKNSQEENRLADESYLRKRSFSS